MTDEEAAAMLVQLSEHFGERVAPVSFYCDALSTWGSTMKGYDDSLYTHVRYVIAHLNKSNLAARLVYGGEKLRTERCPRHKGQWHGCVFPASKHDSIWCECLSGCNLTGWLPAGVVDVVRRRP